MDGVQCNMTNTMNTPVEALEISYPLRVERYELREGSGGAGRHRGGHGVVRALTVIDHDARVSLQSDRRRFPPYGLHGGADGKRAELDARPQQHHVASCPARSPSRCAQARRSASRPRAAAAGRRRSLREPHPIATPSVALISDTAFRQPSSKGHLLHRSHS